MRQAFLMNLDTLEEFFVRVGQLKKDTVEAREKILRDLLKERKAEYMGQTNKTAPELATELIKKGIRAKSYIKSKGDKHD